MSYISDFKGATFSLFGVSGGNTSQDTNCATQVGQKFALADGRTVVLVQNGGAALVAGNLIQSPATIGANHTGLAVIGTATPIGSTQITVTLGGTAVTANQYAGGYAVVSAGTGKGQTLRIASHPAQSTGGGNVVLTLEDPLSVAIAATDSKVSLTLPQYGSKNGADFTTSGVIINPTTPTGRPIGVTLYPIPATTAAAAIYYGFIVCEGAVGCLNDAGTTIGLGLMPSTNTAGAVMTYATTGNYVGTSTVAGESTKAQLIRVNL